MAVERTASTAHAASGPAPTGTVTFLFSDIEGSTGLVRRLGDEYGALLEQHHSLLRAAFGGHGGHEVDTQGDAFFFAFRRARDAVAAAVAAQRRCSRPNGLRSWTFACGSAYTPVSPGSAPRATTASTSSARRASPRWPTADRSSSRLRPDDVVGDDSLREVSFLDLGEHLLKGFDRAHRLFQVSAPGLPHEFPALRTERAEPGLDIGGREDDLAAAAGAAVDAGDGIGSRFGRRRLVVLLATLALAAACWSGLALTRDDESAPTVVPNSVVRIEPDTNEIVRVLPVGQDSRRNHDERRRRLGCEPKRRHAHPCRQSHGPDANPWRLPVPHLARHARDPDLGREQYERLLLVAIDSETGGEVDRIRFRAAAASYVVHGAGSLWVSDEEEAVLRVSPSTGDIRRRWPESPHGIAFGYGAAWVANTGPGELLRINARDGALQRIDAGSRPEGVTVGFGAVWVACSGDDEVRRFNPATGTVEQIISVGSQPDGIATGAGAVWVTNRNDGTVSRIDPETNRVVATIQTGFSPAGVHVGAGGVWVTVAPASS